MRPLQRLDGVGSNLFPNLPSPLSHSRMDFIQANEPTRFHSHYTSELTNPMRNPNMSPKWGLIFDDNAKHHFNDKLCSCYLKQKHQKQFCRNLECLGCFDVLTTCSESVLIKRVKKDD